MYVEMKHIYKKYGDFLASDDVSFGIEKGKRRCAGNENCRCIFTIWRKSNRKYYY